MNILLCKRYEDGNPWDPKSTVTFNKQAPELLLPPAEGQILRSGRETFIIEEITQDLSLGIIVLTEGHRIRYGFQGEIKTVAIILENEGWKRSKERGDK